MRQFRHFYRPVLVVSAVCGLVGWTALARLASTGASNSAVKELDAKIGRDLGTAVENVDRLFQNRWADEEITPAEPADELQVLRRLSLALVGTVPSLAEVREFEADTRPDRLRRWTVRLIADQRFSEYFAERLAIAFAGEFEQKAPLFTHARFETWLADQLAAGRPYDEMVREMISQTGPPTTNGAANFVTAEIVQGEQYANRLAARTARAFLGQRIDCAECHDHPFDHWKQADFQGLAAHFAQVRTRSVGIEEDRNRQHEVEDRKTLEKQIIEPRVPFHDDWVGKHRSRREKLAAWVTHHENRRFLRAISNRVWGLLFGRPFISPVDSIPDPRDSHDAQDPDAENTSDPTELLDVLAADLREHGSDLRRLVLVIASSRPFRMSSAHPVLETGSTVDCERLAGAWGVFPLTSLRPEQLARSFEQTASLHPLKADENVVTRVRREIFLRKFVSDYGSFGENELDEHTDSIPQTIHRMHSRFTRDASRAGWTNTVGRIAVTAPSAAACLETCYLVCLTRRSTDAERDHFLTQFRESRSNRSRVVEDIFWTLMNSPEFGWNH